MAMFNSYVKLPEGNGKIDGFREKDFKDFPINQSIDRP